MPTVTDRRDLRRRLLQIAGRQSGMFTAAQAREVGYSYAAQKYHADHGNWTRIDRGVFRLAEWPAGPHEDLVRWVIWSGSRGVVSHESALAVHEIGEIDPARIHLTVPPGFRKSAPGLILHRTALPAQDIQHHEGVAVTTPVRALLDVAAGDLDLDHLADAIRDAIDEGKATRRDLLKRADDFGAHAALRIERALRGGG
jgi:predicted transcriptional regulator of viral defense system